MCVRVFMKPLKNDKFSNVENYTKLFRYENLGLCFNLSYFSFNKFSFEGHLRAIMFPDHRLISKGNLFIINC